MADQEPRDRTVGGKVTATEMTVVQRAAESRGQTVSTFLRDVAVEAAWAVVLSHAEHGK